MYIDLSIVITCYNLGEYLNDALQSMKALKYDNTGVEIVLVDDGSTSEKTKDAIEVLKSEFDIVIIQENMGLGKARNNGIEKSKGKYILPFDADNKLEPSFIEGAISILEENEQIGAVYGDRQKFEGSDELVTCGGFKLSKILISNYIDACAVIRRSAWKSLGGYDENMPHMGFEDWDFWLRMSNLGWKIEYLSRLSFFYRVREVSMITETNKKWNDLREYIFSKSELEEYALLRDAVLARRELTRLSKNKFLVAYKKINRLMRNGK